MKILFGKLHKQGLNVNYQELLEKINKSFLNKILKTLTVVEKNNHKKPKGSVLIIRNGYIFDKGLIIFPRIKSNIFLNYKIIDEIEIIDPYESSYQFIKLDNKKINLYDYQSEIINYLLDNKLNENQAKINKSICYLQLDTGLGKTRIGCYLINELQCRTLIVVPTIAIGHQWLNECKELFPEIKTVFYHNNQNINIDEYDVIVIVVNTLIKKSFNFVKTINFIIYDEAHEYHTLCYSKILWFIGSIKYALGLSATPLERIDELDKYVTLHLGQPIYANTISKLDKNIFNGTVKCIKYYGHKDYIQTVTNSIGLISSISTINNIIHDPSRIKLIINEINTMFLKKHSIYVFAEHRHFLDILKENLLPIIDFKFIKYFEDDNISILRGGVSKDIVNDIRFKQNHIVLTTYGYSKRGLSITNMTSIILTTPRRNGLRQIIGRILRKGSNESIIREIVDIVDERTIFKHQFNDRKKIYEEKKYPITYFNIFSDEDSKIEDNFSNIDLSLSNIDSIVNMIDQIYAV